MTGVNDLEWLTAVSEHPRTVDGDVAVAAAIILGDASRAEDVEGMPPFLVDLAISQLEAIGALVPEVQDGAETIYRLALPEETV